MCNTIFLARESSNETTQNLFIAAFLAMSVSSLEIVSRNDWGARSPRTIEHMDKNVPYVIIHHSYTPKACYSSIDCKNAMRSMQNFHQDDRGWFDIGYT